MKLSQLLSTHKVTSTGFPAIAGLGVHSTGNKDALLSSLPPTTLHAQGVIEYYALTIPAGAQWASAEDIIAADPEVQLYRISEVDTTGLPTVLTTQREETLKLLQLAYPHVEVLSQQLPDGSPRRLTAEDVSGKYVIGALPPFLIAAAAAYTPATIKDYDAAVDNDLSAEAVKARLQVANTAIKVVRA